MKNDLSSAQANILIVEDSPVEAELLRRILVKAGYRVTLAKNGKEALQALSEHPCALVISDIMMPLMDGYELCREIKRHEKLWSIPVILISVLSEAEDLIKALNVGADSYLTKPYVEASLLARIHSLLSIPIHRSRSEERRTEQVEYNGKHHTISGDSRQMLNLLMSVYENTLSKNRELVSIQAQLNLLNDNLEDQVQERTAALRKSEEKHRLLYESSRDALMVIMPPSWRFTDANQATLQLFGASSMDELTALGPWDIAPERQPDGRLSSEIAQEMIAIAMREGSHFFEWEHQRLNGETFASNVLLTRMKVDEDVFLQATVRDISERKQQKHALLRKTAMYAVLSATNSAIVHIQDRQKLFDETCRIATVLGGFRLAWIGVVNEPDRRVVAVAVAGDTDNLVPSIMTHCCGDMAGKCCCSAVIAIQEHRHVVSNDFLNDANTAPWHDAALRYGIRSSLSLPIRGGGIRGAFVVYAAEQNYFQQDAIELLLEMAEDVSFALDKIQAAEQHRQDEAQLHLHAEVFDHSSEGMLITDADNNILMVNQAFTDTTGYTLAEVKGKNPRILKSDRHEHYFYVPMWKTLLTQGFWQGEIWNRSKKGEILPMWSSFNTVKDVAGKVVNYFAVYSDLSQKKALEQLHHLLRHDALTDLPNRLLLEDRVMEAITHAHQYGRYVAVLFINLDHFHAINDLLGHVAGDRVLQTIAERLSASAGERATVSRFSGDTFVVVLPDINHPSEINEITQAAEILLGVVAEPLSIEEQDIELTARIGIALYPNDGENFAELMKNADLAALQAKEDGRNSYCYFTSSMNVHSRHLITMRGELRHALKNNWFVLYYQPQVNILSGEIIGCEALIRLNHPERGLIPPLEFIAVAEETGLIIPIGEWVIRKACAQMKRWQDEGHNDLVMAVNVSPLQFRQPNLIAVIRQALAESGLAPQHLELEFTESALMKNMGSTLELMHNFKQIGLRLAIDDFGTGYSSLNYLKQFPVDKLKIDQSFVQNIASDPNDASIVQAVIAIARSMGLSTIAEGVETEAQLGYLRSLHCNEIQGYYFGRPVPPDEFLALLQREHEVVKEPSARTLLLVDDEENVLIALKRILHREGYHILTAANADEALELLAKNNVCVVVSDQRMPGMSGVEFLRRVKLMYPITVRMILSGYTEVGTLTDAINKGEIYQFITKPWENEAVIAAIREAFLRYESLKKNGR